MTRKNGIPNFPETQARKNQTKTRGLIAQTAPS
jgi:hypothetical protein